ncbi:MAG TPA: site-2 protease family protein [Anaerolineaceae bacterium]
MDIGTDTAVVDAVIRRVFLIDDVTLGGPKDPYSLRYHGRLLSADSARLYDQLAADLKPLGYTPLFRWDGAQQEIRLVRGVVEMDRPRSRLNVIMFILTVLSVLFVGATYAANGNLPSSLQDFLGGLPFAVSLMAILSAHEFGHYLVGRWRGTPVSLPYFIPIPVPPFGTMGAFINMKAPPKNRNTLLEIGMAGPIAGLVVAIPVLLIGLALSPIEPIPAVTPQGMALTIEGNSLLYLFSKFLVFGQLLPAPASYGGVSPLIYWVRYFFTGQPVPLGGMDVILDPVAWAGWGGLLVTALNLIPAGQLDGGHILYVLFGRKGARRVLPVILVALVALGFFWNGWWLWAALIFFLVGRTYAEPLDQITPLDGPHKLLAVIMLGVFLLVFMPVPFSVVYGAIAP